MNCDVSRSLLVATDAARALAGVALLVEPVGARERGAALAAVCERKNAKQQPQLSSRDGARLVRAEHSIARVETKKGLIVTNRDSNDRSAAGRNGHICRTLTGAWDVRNQALGLEETVAAGLAAVVVEEGAAEAPGAVLALLVGAEAAELAGRGGVLVGGAPAAVADFLAHNAAPLALEGGEAPPAELGDTERSHPGGAALDALAVEHVPTVAALHGRGQSRF